MFPQQMKAPVFSGRDVGDEIQVVERRGGGKALVKDRHGDKALLVATAPLEARNDQGRLAPVDLSLQRTAAAIAPTNSNAPFTIDPVSPAKVRFTDLGIAMRVAGAKDSPGGPLLAGRPSAAQITNDRAFFSAVLTDTDVGIVPLPRGAQLFLVARSQRAPQQFSLGFELPAGATLRRAVSDTPLPAGLPRSAEIVKDGKTLAYVSPPIAHDADGRGVPASMSIDGQQLVLDVPHRGRDIRYPINIDPTFTDPSNHAVGFSGWAWDQSISTGPWFGSIDNCALYCGLYQGLSQNKAAPNGSNAFFFFPAPAKTAITQATLGGLSHKPYVIANLPFTQAYEGILNNTAWERGRFSNRDGLQPDTGYAASVPTTAGYTGSDNTFTVTRTPQPAQEQNKAIVAMRAINHQYGPNIGPSPTMYALTTMAWAQIQLTDNYPPKWHPDTIAPTDIGWKDDNTDWHSRSFRATDEGLGVGAITLTGASEIKAPADQTGPTGVIDGTTVSPACQARPTLCPSLDWPKEPIQYKLNEGINTLTTQATDITDTPINAPARTWKETIDRSPPTITPSGSLYDSRGTAVSSGTYLLHVDARDGDRANAAARRSGVTRVLATIDDEPLDSVEADCPQDSCSVVRDITFNTSDYPGGDHTLSIEAEDALGHTSTTSFSFSTPCCLAAASTVGSSTLAERVRYADVNGDTKADAVIVDASGAVKVALSEGTTFSPAQSWGSAPSLAAVSVGDVNGDGKADLAYRESTGDPLIADAQRVQVMLSTGSQFAAAVNWGPWSSSYDLRLDDVDGDEADDLIGRSSATGQIQVAYSLEDQFAPAETWTTVATNLQWSTADPNGDGYADLVLRDSSTGNVSVGVSDSGSFAVPAQWGVVAGNGDVLFDDIDGNLADDAVFRDPANGAVRVAASDRQGFAAPTNWGTVASGDVQVDLADIDGDGSDDVLTRNKLTGVITANRSNVVTPVNEEAAFVPDPTVEYDDGDGAAPRAAGQATEAGPTMKLAWADDPLLIGGDNGKPVPEFDAVNDAVSVRAIWRMRQAGATTARLFVFWGAWAKRGPAYKAALDAAVNRLTANGMTVYMTLTGADYDDPINGKKTSVNPVPADFATFVTEAVTRYEPMGVRDYAMWNEPNLPRRKGQPTARFLERPRCSNGKRLTTAKLYQSLYVAGYDAAKAVSPGTRIYLGEFAQEKNPGFAACNSTRKASLDLYRYLELVVDSPPGGAPLKTNGVAWHPYQAQVSPDDADNTVVGIGRIGGMKTIVQRLAKENKLRTVQGKAPRLYLTEFGYLNRPISANTSAKSWHREAKRAIWLDRALRKARNGASDPGMFVFYKLVETPPANLALPLDDPVNLGSFDTGVVDPASFAVTGQRGYGKGDRTRGAYCAIRAYAKNPARGYPILGPRPLEEQPDQCP